MARDIQAIVNRQVLRWNAEQKAARERSCSRIVPGPVITISRQLGSGGSEVASAVARRMNCEVIGHEIINDIARRHGVREEIVRALDERTRTQQEIWIDSMIHKLHFDESDYYRHLLAAVRSLAEMGSVVLLGRGACFIETSRPKINIRVIAPMADRVDRVVKRFDCDPEAAKETIDKKDHDQAKFIKSLFDKEIDEPLNYDVLINTASVSIGCAAAIIERVWFHNITTL